MLAASPARHASLPLPLTTLVGREREIAATGALLTRPEVRLVTLTGAGGVGKTRIAIAVAEAFGDAFADGVVFVPLAAIHDPDLVPSAIAQSFGVQQAGLRPLGEVIGASIGKRSVLLVLDNFEQVLPAASVVSNLLSTCPGLVVLVTSRAGLNLYGEHNVLVPTLALADPRALPALEQVQRIASIQLFVDRARQAKADFALTSENAAVVAAICARLDGLPLAIELAAARVKLFTPTAMLTRMEKSLQFLTGGPRDVPARQRTVRDTIAWSYELLSPDVQRLFRRLAVFRGGITLEAAEAVCNGDTDILFGLAALVDHSLLRQIDQPDGSSRFAMLPTIAEFALEQLVTDGEFDQTHRRHAEYYLELADPLGPDFVISDSALILIEATHVRVEEEFDNLRAALEWTLEHYVQAPALLDTMLRLVAWTWDLWENHGRLNEGRRWIEAALDRSRGAGDRARALALFGAGILATEQAEFARARAFQEEALAIAGDLNDPWIHGLAMFGLGKIALWQGDYEHAAAVYDESIALSRRLGIDWWLSAALNLRGNAAIGQRDYGRAIRLLEEALSLRQALTGENDDPNMRIELGQAYLLHGDRERARECLTAGLRQLHSLGRSRYIADSLERLAGLAVAEQQPEHAVRLLGFAGLLREELGTPPLLGERADLDQRIGATRAQLPAPVWEAAWAAGRALSLGDAVDAALNPPVALESTLTILAPASGMLTAREMDVLRLLVEGLSDREIAERLFISPRTVMRHVTGILNTLGVTSRTAAATWAMRHGLGDLHPTSPIE
jgi:predicted ATPase/DNA-binding CsgD family transcriptional regulator